MKNKKDLEFQNLAQWHVLRGETKSGPFSYLEVISMLQGKDVFEFDYIWKKDMKNWERIALLEEFSSEAIGHLKKNEDIEVKDVFHRRRHLRTAFQERALVHNNKCFWNGKGIEISSGGAGIIMENATLQPKDVLFIHFVPSGEIPAFNAICEVVGKQYVDGVEKKDEPIRYDVKFTGLDIKARKNISVFINKKFPNAS